MDKKRWRLSLQSKITWVIVVLVFTFGGVVIYAIGRLIESSMISQKEDSLKSVLAEQSGGVDTQLRFVKSGVEEASKIPEIERYLSGISPKMQDNDILNLFHHYSVGRGLSALYIINDKGVTLTSTDPTFVGQDFSFRKYVQNALAGVSCDEIAIGSVSKKLGFYFSAPVKDSVGKTLGVVVAKLDPDGVFSSLEKGGLANYGNVMLVNGDGVIVYSSKESFLYKSLSPLSAAVEAEIGKENRYPGVVIEPLGYDPAMKYVNDGKNSPEVFYIFDEVDKEEELLSIGRVGEFPYFIVSESNKASILAVISRISLFAGGIILLALIAVTATQSTFLGYVMKPLGRLKNYAEKVSGGSLDEEINIQTGDELESLAESIQSMVASIKKSYSGLEMEVQKKTAELSENLLKIQESNQDLEKSKIAMVNVLEDLKVEKEKIAAEKNRIQTILSSIGDGVFVTDVAGKVIMVNHAAERLVGLSSLELYNKPYDQVFNFRDESDIEKPYPDFVSEAMKSGKITSLLPHTVLVSKSGARVPVLDSAAPLRSLQGTVFGCVVVFRDNTKERELERNKDDFLSVASHQLRTPLGSMRWNLEMLMGGDAGKLGSEAEEIAKQVLEANLRMIDLVNELLDVSRIDQGRVMNDPVELSLDEVLNSAIKETEPLTVDKNIKIVPEIEKGIPKITVDSKKIREVVQNLLSNAIKYNKEGGEVRISLKKSGENAIEIVFEDTGIGIPKEDMSSLFGRFFRAENAVHSETVGSGLGLYVVKTFVNDWGGTINVESELGKGSKFTIHLPINIINNNNSKNG